MTLPHSPTGPLAGLKVVELGQLIAGPFAAKTLADFGADVVKVEPPRTGDPLRQWRLVKDGTSVWWQVQSRNKRSIALDLKQPDAQAVVRALATEADVLVENFRPGAMEGWGPWPRRPAGAEPAPGGAAHQWLRPDRPLPRPALVLRWWPRAWVACATSPANPAAHPCAPASALATRWPACTASSAS